METSRRFWRRQDGVSRIILIAGTVLTIVALVKGEWSYGAVLLLLTAAFCAAHGSAKTKRLSRLYGTLCFHAPGGEVVPVSFEQVKTEYVKGAGTRYMGRRLTVRFPYCRMNEEGRLDSGFGLCADVSGFADTEGLLPTLRRGDFLSVTGKLMPRGRDYFYIGEIEELRRISEKEVFMR